MCDSLSVSTQGGCTRAVPALLPVSVWRSSRAVSAVILSLYLAAPLLCSQPPCRLLTEGKPGLPPEHKGQQSDFRITPVKSGFNIIRLHWRDCLKNLPMEVPLGHQTKSDDSQELYRAYFSDNPYGLSTVCTILG